MTSARRTLGCWVLSAFLQRGCEPLAARAPRKVWRVRSLSAREAAAMQPLAVLAALVGAAPGRMALVAASNLLWMPTAGSGRGHRQPAAAAVPLL